MIAEERFKELERRVKELEDTQSQYTLREIIEELEEALASHGDIVLDYSFVHPHCYRGYYREVAFAKVNQPQSLTKAIEVFKSAVNWKYQGYKGGWFKMTEHTKVWISKDWSVDSGQRFDSITMTSWIQCSESYQNRTWQDDEKYEKALMEKYG